MQEILDLLKEQLLDRLVDPELDAETFVSLGNLAIRLHNTLEKPSELDTNQIKSKIKEFPKIPKTS